MPLNKLASPKLLPQCLALILCAVLQTGAQTDGSDTGKRVGVRLRSFVPEAIGSLYFEPTTEGGLVRLTALGLPVAEDLSRDAHAYLVWAVANGESPLRVGVLELDGGGNGGLEFTRPPAFHRYAIVVTAEPDRAVSHPNGVMVFASRARAVEAQYGEQQRPRLAESQRRALEKELRKSSAGRNANDFYAEVDNALDSSPNGGRVVELVGTETAPKARGAARLATQNENLYLRTLIKKLPPASTVGASSYVLWGIAPHGRITYMGSLPTSDGDDADTYVRVAGINANELDLLVSAETRRPVSSPSGRRALASPDEAVADVVPAFGAVEGRVLDAEGMPVAGAVVEARPFSDTVVSDNLPVAYTDERGVFFLDGLRPGEHVIYASKEEEGYPSIYQVLFVADAVSLPTVTIESQQVARDLTVRLARKGARLRAHLINAVTDKPIEVAEVTLYRDDKADSFFSFGLNEKGELYRLVPSMPLKMKIVAPGYGEWHYGADGTQEKAESLSLEPDKEREITIRLQPLR